MKFQEELLRYFFKIGILILLTGCSKAAQLPLDSMPNVGIPAGELNNRLRITAPPGLNTWKIGDMLGISVTSIKDDVIVFQGSDLNVRLFSYSKGEWTELPNRLNVEKKVITLYPQSDPRTKGMGLTTYVIPTVSDSTKVTSVRIIVVGNIFRDGHITDEKTGAYIDVFLRP